MIRPSLLIAFLMLGLPGMASDEVPEEFVALSEIDPGIRVELRYHGSDNFAGDPIDGYEKDVCLMTRSAAEALKKVHEELKGSGLGLKVYDAYRPQRAVNHFVRWARDLNDKRMKAKYYPNVRKAELFEKGYIAQKSGHSRGSTVDVTIVSLEGGEEIDMGTGWDHFGPESWPSSMAVEAQPRANRLLLRNFMVKHGFVPLKEEWWHFTLKDEPFPKTYFDFPIR